MLSVIVAQFLSAFGDNALLFATLALLKAQFLPGLEPACFAMVFVGATFFLRRLAARYDKRFAKGRVMMVANGLNWRERQVFRLGVNFVGYTLVGIMRVWLFGEIRYSQRTGRRAISW